MQLQFIPFKIGSLWSNIAIPALLPICIAVLKVFTWYVVQSPRRSCLDVFNCPKIVLRGGFWAWGIKRNRTEPSQGCTVGGKALWYYVEPKIPSQRMMCGLAHCRGEGTTCLQFHGGRAQLCFSNARVSVGKMFDSESVRVAQTPCEQFPFNKKNDEHGFHSWFAHSGLLWSRWLGSVPLWTLSFGCGIVLENPSFISSYHSLQKVPLTCHTIQESPRNQHMTVLLFIGQILRDLFRTNFSHVHIFRNDSVDVRFR